MGRVKMFGFQKRLCEKTITFKYAHPDYCEYRPYNHPWDKEYEGRGVLVCPLRFKDYEDGYSASYACLLDGGDGNQDTPCRFKEIKKDLDGKRLVKELKII